MQKYPTQNQHNLATTSPTLGEQETDQTSDRLFLTLPYHPSYIPRRTIREIYRNTCEDELRQELGIEQMTVGYKHATYIGDIVTWSKLSK